MNIERLDGFTLWGGNNSYNPSTETLTINRPYGLYSNITVSMFAICILKTMNYDVRDIRFYLNEYENDYNFYPDLFIPKNKNEEVISAQDANFIVSNFQPTNYGLSNSFHRYDKHLLEQAIPVLYKIYKHYFDSESLIQDLSSSIINKYDIDLDNDIFIWARKSDKIHESHIPDAVNYLEKIKNISYKSILLQTDDPTVITDFGNLHLNNLVILNELPYTDNIYNGFHNHLSSISSDMFSSKYQMSKIDYLRKFLALTNIASKCKYFVCYPGNMITIVPIIKQTFNHCILFLNKENIV